MGEVFLKKFNCDIVGLVIINKRAYQIWLHVREENEKVLESCYIFGDMLEPICLNMMISNLFFSS
jgi:hypothetical protein